MSRGYYFTIEISDEQLEYTKKLVDYSFNNHNIPNIFDFNKEHSNRQYKFRFIGTLGEVIFADTYNLERPKKSFGAIDGQDFGQDFILSIGGNKLSIDVKTMSRKNCLYKGNYSMNLSKYQVEKEVSNTDYYAIVNISKYQNRPVASFFGIVNKNDILNGLVGKLYLAGSKMDRDDGTSFNYVIDNYDVKFNELLPPIIPRNIHKMPSVRKYPL